MTDETQLAELIHELRTLIGLTQTELGQRVGLSKLAILRIENRQRRIHWDEAHTLLNALRDEHIQRNHRIAHLIDQAIDHDRGDKAA